MKVYFYSPLLNKDVVKVRDYLECDFSNLKIVKDLLDFYQIAVNRNYIVVVNNKRSEMDYELKENDKIMYIPIFGGG